MKFDIRIFYSLLLTLTEDNLIYHLFKHPDNPYIEFAKNLYNIKLSYPSLLIHPFEFLNLTEFYSVKNNEVSQINNRYIESYLYEDQYSYFDKFVFGLRAQEEFHFEFYKIDLQECMFFTDINDAIKYMGDIHD